MPLDATRQAQRAVADLRAAVARGRSVLVGSDEIRNSARALVDEYFRNHQPVVAEALKDEEPIRQLDAEMQKLLRLAQGRSRRTSYLKLLKNIRRGWEALEVQVAATNRAPARRTNVREHQEQILQMLESVCPPAAACYGQALIDLGAERRSWRGTASELRESLRELLDKLAPDEEVTKAQGFKLEPDAKGPTMKQKTRFILKARQQTSDARKSVEEAIDVIEEQVGSFIRSVYTRASGSVHVQRTRQEVVSILRFVETCMIELLQLSEGDGEPPRRHP